MTDELIKVSYAAFNSERFWKNNDVSTLPNFTDSQADNIVEVMDEMQFVFGQGDKNLILSRRPMNNAHKDYLSALGYQIINNRSPIGCVQTGRRQDSINICELILNHKREIAELDVLETHSRVEMSPFSVLPNTCSLLHSFNKVVNTLPGGEVVQKVNSKVYSSQLEKKIEAGNRGKTVFSSHELDHIGLELLQSGTFVIKDAFGVSGNGNIRVKSKNVLNSIVKHLRRQELKGKRTELVTEPYLDKKIDFSCQFRIQADGQVKISSVQIMENDGFKFSAIRTADSTFTDLLEKENYFQVVEKVAKELYAEGYFGPVCLDSMLLKNGEIIPVIEVNARKSMGLISEQLSVFLRRFGENLKQKVVTLNVSMKTPVHFDTFLDRLEKEGMLFKPGESPGVIPISANTLDVNGKMGFDTAIKGRLYYAVSYRTIEEFKIINNKIQEMARLLGLKIV